MVTQSIGSQEQGTDAADTIMKEQHGKSGAEQRWATDP